MTMDVAVAARIGAVTSLVALVSCDPPPTEPLELGRSASVLNVTMDEYRFQHSPVPRGRVVFRVRNVGKLDHDMTIVPLPAGLPPIVELLKSPTRLGVRTIAYVDPRSPGETRTFAMDLAPGRYAMVCFVTDTDGQQHSVKGMASEFTIGKAPTQAQRR